MLPHLRLEAIEIQVNGDGLNGNVEYRTHVQNDGWQDYVANGAMAGTKGRSLRLEAIQIKVNGDGLNGGVEYATHVQNDGWQVPQKPASRHFYFPIRSREGISAAPAASVTDNGGKPSPAAA